MTIDRLTGLPIIRRPFDSIPLPSHPYDTLVLFDADTLIVFNDLLGMPPTDLLLQEATSKIVQFFGDASQVFRVGGDEFLVATGHHKATAAQLFSLLQSIEMTDITVSVPYTDVTHFSFSCALASHAYPTSEQFPLILQRLQDALHAEKGHIENRRYFRQCVVASTKAGS